MRNERRGRPKAIFFLRGTHETLFWKSCLWRVKKSRFTNGWKRDKSESRSKHCSEESYLMRKNNCQLLLLLEVVRFCFVLFLNASIGRARRNIIFDLTVTKTFLQSVRLRKKSIRPRFHIGRRSIVITVDNYRMLRNGLRFPNDMLEKKLRPENDSRPDEPLRRVIISLRLELLFAISFLAVSNQ